MSDSPDDTHTIVVSQRWRIGWGDLFALLFGGELHVTFEIDTRVTYTDYPDAISTETRASMEVVQGGAP